MLGRFNPIGIVAKPFRRRQERPPGRPNLAYPVYTHTH